MKLRHQIIALGLLGALAAALVGGIGLIQTNRLAVAIDESDAMSGALQSSQEADMMHDAVRGDVLLALLGASTKNEEQMAEAKKAWMSMQRSLPMRSKAWKTAPSRTRCAHC